MRLPARAPTSLLCSIPTNARRADRSHAHRSRSVTVSRNRWSSAPLASQCRRFGLPPVSSLVCHVIPIFSFSLRTNAREPRKANRKSRCEGKKCRRFAQKSIKEHRQKSTGAVDNCLADSD